MLGYSFGESGADSAVTLQSATGSRAVRCVFFIEVAVVVGT